MSEEAHELRKYIRDTQDKGQHWIWNGREIELTPTGTFSFFRPDGSPAFALDLGRNFVPLYHDRGLIVRFTAEEMALHAADNNQKVWLLTPQDMASFKESDLLLELWREEVEYQQMLASMDDVGRRVRFVGAARGQGLEVARNRLEGEAVEDKEPDAKRRRMVG